ncbi:MAG: peptidylprolyl isomerase [candidate division Zixibacteria bacterium]|nr:peptidylprolyl isomerase [candidate division Zixibacteria bacterium]
MNKERKWFLRKAIGETLAVSLVTLALIGVDLFGFVATARSGVEDADPLERVVARVGRHSILLSQLASQAQMAAMQSGFRPETDEQAHEFQKEILRQMINEKLFLVAANQDTTITVSKQEVKAALDAQIAEISSRFPGETAFLTALASEGLTLRDLRRKLKTEVEGKLLRERYIGLKLSNSSISRKEVEDFYQAYKDSIPDQPAGARIAHILLTFTPSGVTIDSVKNFARSIRKKVTSGVDFEALAIQYGSNPSGDLGFINYDDVTPEFGRVAFSLRVGEVSGLLRTASGFHIIKSINRIDDSVRISQILFPVIATSADSALIFGLADSLKQELIAGAKFAKIAKIFSADDDTRRTEGELGWFAFDDLPDEFVDYLSTDSEVGDISGPALSLFGLHLIRVLEIQVATEITFETHYDQIRDLARSRKSDLMIEEWIEERTAQVHITIFSLE